MRIGIVRIRERLHRLLLAAPLPPPTVPPVGEARLDALLPDHGQNLLRQVYAAWYASPPSMRTRARWVMSRETWNLIVDATYPQHDLAEGIQRNPDGATLLIRPIRIDPDAVGVTLEQVEPLDDIPECGIP